MGKFGGGGGGFERIQVFLCTVGKMVRKCLRMGSLYLFHTRKDDDGFSVSFPHQERRHSV